MKGLVTFDLDGTLIDTLTDLAEACNYALRSSGFPLHPEEEYKNFVGNGLQRLIEQSLPSEGWSNSDYEQVFGLFCEYYALHGNDSTKPYPGVVELLGGLKDRGARIAVLSNKPHEYTAPLVESIFPGLVDLVLGQRKGVPIKPDPAALLEILDHFGVEKEKVIYVGDSDVDMRTGSAAGLYTVGVTWGYRTKEDLEKAGACVIANNREELFSVLLDWFPLNSKISEIL